MMVARPEASMEKLSGMRCVMSSPNAGLIIAPAIPINDRGKLIFALASRYRLPAVYANRFFTVDGGLLSDGPDILDMYRRSATYGDESHEYARSPP